MGWWRWALVSPDGVAPSRIVGVSASVNLPLDHKVQKFSSGTGSCGGPRKRAVKWLCGVCVVCLFRSVGQIQPGVTESSSSSDGSGDNRSE